MELSILTGHHRGTCTAIKVWGGCYSEPVHRNRAFCSCMARIIGWQVVVATQTNGCVFSGRFVAVLLCALETFVLKCAALPKILKVDLRSQARC